MIAYAGEDGKQGNTPPLLVGLKTYTEQTLLKSIWCFLRKLRFNLPPNPTIALLGIYPMDFSSYHRDSYTTMIVILVL